MRDRFDRDNLSLYIPNVFESLKSVDANFEMVTSNLLQPLTLFFTDNIVTSSIAYIFMNTHCKGLQYIDAKQIGKQAYSLFKDILEFQTVIVCEDRCKLEIINCLNEVTKYAQRFEE